MTGKIAQTTLAFVMVAPDYDPGSRYAFTPDQVMGNLFTQLSVGDGVTFEYHTPESHGRMVITGRVA
jgi:hypothetical protein